MKRTAKTRRKYIFFSLIGILALTGVIVSLVAVLAASTQAVSSNITVTYISNNVSATVTGKYWYSNEMSTKSDIGTVTFNASDNSTTSTMPNKNIVLSVENKRVVFEYAIKNNSYNAVFTVDLANSPRILANGSQTANYTNITEKYFVSSRSLQPTYFNSDLFLNNLTNTLNVQPIMGQRVGQNDTVYIYVVVEIVNLALNANYSGSFVWDLANVTRNSTNIQQLTLNNNTGTGATSMNAVVVNATPVNLPVIFTLPTKEGYAFEGYYTQAEGGTQYIKADGSPNGTINALNTGSITTLYAHWNEYFEVSNGYELTGLTANGELQQELTIPYGITAIGDNTFEDNTSLQFINLPEGLEELGDNAFEGCTNLREVNFNAVQPSVASVSVSQNATLTIGDYAFKDCTSLTTIEIPGYATLSTTMFDGCTNLKNITGPIYGNSSISNLTGVNLTVNGTQTYLDNGAFMGYSGLRSIIIANNITTIEESAFLSCTNLESVTIGSGVSSIYEDAFNNCPRLISITLNANNTSYVLQDGILYNTAKTSIILVSKSITGAITLPNSLTSIGNSAFSGCTGLTSITTGTGVTRIGYYAFSGCTSLANVTLGANIDRILDRAFNGCTSLTSITIPNGVRFIGKYAFISCPLTSVYINSNIDWYVGYEGSGEDPMWAGDGLYPDFDNFDPQSIAAIFRVCPEYCWFDNNYD